MVTLVGFQHNQEKINPGGNKERNILHSRFEKNSNFVRLFWFAYQCNNGFKEKTKLNYKQEQ